MQIQFSERGMDEYISWQNEDRKTLKKINQLLKDISRNPFDGIGKPEPLKGDFAGYWSRRINEKDRLIYQFQDSVIYVFSIKGHYSDK
jgi:toxin YoeB